MFYDCGGIWFMWVSKSRCIISLRHENFWNMHVHWARSVRKLYDYTGVLLWIMSPLAGRDRTGTALYVARWEIACSFIPCWVWRKWRWHMHCIAFIMVYLFKYCSVSSKCIWGFCQLLIWSSYEVFVIYIFKMRMIFLNILILSLLSYLYN